MINLDSSKHLKFSKDTRLSITDFFIQIIAVKTFFMTFIFPIITIIAIIFSIGYSIIHFKETGMLGMLHFFSVSVIFCYISINLIMLYISFISKYRFRDAGIFDYIWVIYLIVNVCLINLIPLMFVLQGKDSVYIDIYVRFSVYFCFPISLILNGLLFLKRSKLSE